MTRIDKPYAAPDERQAGMSLIEVSMCMALLVIGLLGFLASMVSSQLVARSTSDADRAYAEIVAAVESLRADCESGFDAAVNALIATPVVALSGPGKDAQIVRTVVVDEPLVTPSIDLNGDGDFTDTGVATAGLTAAVVVFRLTWTGVGGPRVVDETAILARDAQ